MAGTGSAAPVDADRRDELSERLFNSLIATFELTAVHAGLRLGLYTAMRDAGPLSVGEFARRAGIDERYAREWLEQQAVAGVLDADTTGTQPRFRLPPEHAEVLLDADNPAFAGAAAGFVDGVARVLPLVLDAYRTGAGVPYGAYGEELRRGIARFNQPMFVNDLASWFAAVPDLAERLHQPGTRILDLGAGLAASSIALARAFPAARVDAVDLDEASVAEARDNVAAAGAADRVHVEAADAAELPLDRRYDVVCVFEALHDMADPVATLRAVRSVLADDGAVLVADEKVAEEFTGRGDLVERLNHAFSWWHCLPATRAENGPEANGTVLRPSTVRAWAADAGFSHVGILPIDNDLWRFYRLDG